MTPRVFLTHTPSDLRAFFPQSSLDRLMGLGSVTTHTGSVHLTPQQLLAAAPDHHYVITEWNTGADETYFETNTSLIAICRVGVDIFNIDVAAATANGVLAVNVPGVYQTSVIELTLAYMITLARRVPTFEQQLRSGQIPINYNLALSLGHDMPAPGFDLCGSTVGLIGLGHIGTGLAKILLVMGAEVVAYDPYATAVPDGIELVPLDELLERSNIVSLHAKLTPETRHIIGARELKLMGPNAYLVNTARGELVANAALAAALHEGTIAGAAVDVFDTEPRLAGHPLVTAPNCIVTPHVGGTTPATMKALADGAVASIEKLISGQLPDGIVNPEVLSRANLRWRGGGVA